MSGVHKRTLEGMKIHGDFDIYIISNLSAAKLQINSRFDISLHVNINVCIISDPSTAYTETKDH